MKKFGFLILVLIVLLSVSRMAMAATLTLPDGVTVNDFIKSQRIEMKQLCGYRNHWTFDAEKYYESYMNAVQAENDSK